MDKKITKASLMTLIPALLLTFFVNAEQTTESQETVSSAPAVTTQEADESAQVTESEATAEEAESTISSVTPYQMYVTDQLFIFVHSGSSNRYRIIGRIGASEAVQVIAKDSETGWLQVTYDTTKTGWVNSTMITSTSGTKGQLALAEQKITELETKIKNTAEQPDVDIDQLNEQIANLQSDNQALLSQVDKVNAEKQELQASIKEVDETRKILDKLYDVGVILIGIFVGWLLSRRKRSGISFNHL